MDEKRLDKLCDPCSAVYERQTKTVSGFCVQCVEYLCDTCLGHHRKLKASRSHVLLTGHDIPDDKAAYQMLEVVGKCPIHKDEEITYECKMHEEFLCIFCAKDKHLNCKSLVDISISPENDSYSIKLSLTEHQLKTDGDQIKSLKFDVKKRSEKIRRQKEEIHEKQKWIKLRLESALKELRNQEIVSENSFKTQLDKLTLSGKRLDALCKQNKISSKFVEALNKHGKPHQKYIAVHGQFRHIGGEIQAVSEELNHLTGVNEEEFHIDADILNLLLTIEGSKGLCEQAAESNNLCEQSSDSVDDLDIDILPHLNEKPTASSETKGGEEILNDVKALKIKKKHSLNLLERSIDSAKSINVQSKEESTVCDIVGVAIIESKEMIVFADYANKNLKVTDSALSFLYRVALSAMPCGICVLKSACVAVLMVDKIIITLDVTKDGIEHLKTFKTDLYGHSLTNYGNSVAVMCANTKFDIEQKYQGPITILIIDTVNGVVVNQLEEFYLRPREEDKLIKFENPCQIYSRYDSELVIGTKACIKDLDSDGIQRWYYSRGGQLRRVTGITSDHEENLYVCGHDSNNVHQIFSMSYNYSRIIIPDVHRPWAIAYDKKGERLIVTSRQSNSVRTYRFL